MNTDKIEELLQQYGEDCRQQQRAAGRVRLLARRAARIRTAAGCLLLLLAAGAAGLRLSTPRETAPIVAANRPAAPEGTANGREAEAAAETGCSPSLPTPNRPSLADQRPTFNPQPSTLDPKGALLATESLAALEPEAEAPAARRQSSDVLRTLPQIQEMPLAMAETRPEHSIMPSRLRVSAGVGASVSGNTSVGSFVQVAEPKDISYWNNLRYEMNSNSLDAGEYEPPCFTYVTPSYAMSAYMAVAYAVVQSERASFDIGIGLAGNTLQNEMTQRTLHTAAGTKHLTATGSKYRQPVQSLYATMPLTLLAHFRGADRMGWKLSLTPGWQLAATHPTGTSSFNPWKLTLGVGITVPHGLIQSVSLTANMLPTYTNQTMHEFGISLDCYL